MEKNRKIGLAGITVFQRRLSPFVCLGLVLIMLVACGDATSTSVPPTTAPTVAPTSTVAPTTAPALTTASPTTAAAATPTLGNPLSGKTPASNGGATNPTTPGGTPLAGIPDDIKKPFALISTDLEKRSSLPASTFQITGYSQETFPDSALGCPDPGMMYTQVLTPGYIIQVSVGGKTYDYRSNLAGTHVLLCSATGRPAPTP